MAKNVVKKCNTKNKIYSSTEYLENQKQIDCISKVLVENADVPQKLIDWLIEAVRKNTILECKK